jgi:ATP-binding cassette, subfamily B, bacterial
MANPPGPSGQPDLQKYDLSFGGVLRVYFFFFRFIRPYLPHLLLIAALMFIQIPAGQLSLFFVRDVTDQSLLAVDKPTDERMRILIQVLAIQTGLWLLGQFLWKTREILNWYCFMRGTLDLRLAFYRHLHRLPLSFLKKRTPGEHLYRSTSDIMTNHNDPFDAGLMGMVACTVLPIAETVYALVWTSVLLAFIDPWLGLVVAAYVIPYGAAFHFMIGRIRVAGHQEASLKTLETAILRDSIGGMRPLHAMGKILRQRSIYTKAAAATRRVGIKFRWLNVTNTDLVLWGVRWLFSSSLYLYLTLKVIGGEATIGEWTATFLLFEAARLPIESLVGALQSIRIWTINGQRVMQTLTVPPTLTDAPGAKKMDEVRGEITFEEVSLEYEKGRRVLDGINLKVDPGESVAFVGPSGAGKSSLISLLLRLYEPVEGRVLIDGQDLKGLRMESFLRQVALVPQTTFLYDGTLRDNLLFAEPRATEEGIYSALERAEAGPLIARLPGGLDYGVGDAATLSGGEKQRIGIARALLRRPRILILDEATANLDAATEAEILKTMESLYQGLTVLVVAHRLKAASRCQRIVVISGGRVLAQGTHDELMESCKWYRTRWEEQQEGVDG